MAVCVGLTIDQDVQQQRPRRGCDGESVCSGEGSPKRWGVSLEKWSPCVGDSDSILRAGGMAGRVPSPRQESDRRESTP